MLKNISKLGRILAKLEQKEINGAGKRGCCNPTYDCCVHCPGEGSSCDYLYSTAPLCV